MLTEPLWYVYRFNGSAEDWECLGAFALEDDARRCLAEACAEWLKTTNGRHDGEARFPGAVIRQTWSEFRESVFQYRLCKIIAPIEFMAKAAGWPGYTASADQDEQLASK